MFVLKIFLRRCSSILCFISKNIANVFGKYFAEFNTPLIERVYVKDETFNSDSMFIKSKELSTGKSSETSHEEETQTWSVTCEEFMLPERLGDSLALKLFVGLTKGESIGLCKEIRHQLLMIGDWLSCECHWCLGMSKADKFSWNHSSLVHQLVETVLAIGPGLTKDNRASLYPRGKPDTLPSDPFTI